MKWFSLYNRKLPDCFHCYLDAVSGCFSAESEVPQTQVYCVRAHSHLANIQLDSWFLCHLVHNSRVTLNFVDIPKGK